MWEYTDPQATAKEFAEGRGSLKWLLQEHRSVSSRAWSPPWPHCFVSLHIIPGAVFLEALPEA